MEVTETFYAPTREKWRAWLARHHEKKKEIWLVFYKKHTGRPRVAYDDAVEEALCFGWIDGIVKSLDEEKYAQRFTPRKAGSNWSALNKRRVAKLIAEGRMTQAGLAKVTFTPADVEAEGAAKKPRHATPRDFRQALAANETARTNFNNLAPSYRRHYVGWIVAAKRDETRAKRISEAVRLLEQNKKLGMK